MSHKYANQRVFLPHPLYLAGNNILSLVACEIAHFHLAAKSLG